MPAREPRFRRDRCRRLSNRLATGTGAPGAVIGERAEQADGPARRAAPPGDRGEEQEHERDRANDGDQHDREHRRSQADRASEEMLANRTARKRRALRTRWFWRDLALRRHRTPCTRRGRARITRSPVPPDGRGRWLELWLTPMIGLVPTPCWRPVARATSRTRKPDLRDPLSVAPTVAVTEAPLHKRPARDLVPCPTPAFDRRRARIWTIAIVRHWADQVSRWQRGDTRGRAKGRSRCRCSPRWWQTVGRLRLAPPAPQRNTERTFGRVR
jgi:hypothetical protein